MYCKTLLNRMQIQKSTFRNKGAKIHYFVAQGNRKKIIKAIKVLWIKCTPVTCIAKGIAIAHNNRCMLVRQ